MDMGVPVPTLALAAEQQSAEQLEEGSAGPVAVLTLAEETAMFGTYFQELDHLRQSQGTDREWNDIFTQAAQSAMHELQARQPAFAKSAIRQVECGHTLCRLEIQNDDDGLARRVQDPLIHGIGAAAPSATAYRVPETGLTRFYFARPGSDLPPPLGSRPQRTR
jgi:hypothetical protein